MRNLFCRLFVFACAAACAFADDLISEFVSRGWTAEDGLPANSATDVIQDRDGYIYVGTYDGLVRFDGASFDVYSRGRDPAMGFVSARALYQADDGAIWLGSNDEGVFRIVMDSGEPVRSFSTKNGLPNNSVRAVCGDGEGNVYVATAGGLARISPDFAVSAVDAGGASPLRGICTSLFCDSSNRVWVTTTDEGGVFVVSGGRAERYSPAGSSFAGSVVSCVSQDRSGAMWFGFAPRFAAMVAGGGEQVFDLSCGSGGTVTVSDITQDSDGAIWFATDAGITLLRGGDLMRMTEEDGLFDNKINRIIEDREGNIWVATDQSGIQKMTRGLFRTHRLPSAVNAIAEGRDGREWLGCDKGLECRRTAEDGALVSEANAVTEFCAGRRIRHVSVARNGDILVSAYAELGQMRFSEDGRLVGQWRREDGLAGEKVRVAEEDPSTGDLYIGTTKGLSVVRAATGEVQTYTTENGLTHDYIMAVYVDERGGNVWLGTDGGGIMAMDRTGAVVERHSTADGLAGNIVFKIGRGPDGDLWVCTGTGISRISGGRIRNYGRGDGLGTDSVFQILDDGDNNVWLTSNAGVSRVAADSFSRGGKLSPKFYSRFDGLRSRGVTSTSRSVRDSLGRMWFPLLDGFAVCDPRNVRVNTVRPTVHIERVTIDDAVVYPSEDGSVRIPAGARKLGVRFAGLSFASAEPVRVSYRLDGFDADFSEPSSSKTASYTNLAPGEYRFRLRAVNGDGLWSDEDSRLSFSQGAFVWQLLWFRIAVVAAVAAVIARLGIIIYRMVRQLHALKSAIAGLSSGSADLTKRVAVRGRSSFPIFNELVAEENRFLEKFQGIIAKVKDSEANLRGVGAEMGRTTENAAGAIGRISGRIEGVHGLISSQNDSVREAAVAVKRIADGISSLEKLVEAQTGGVHSASDAVEQMVANIRSVSAAMDNMAGLFSGLESLSEAGQEKERAVVAKIAQIEEKSRMLQEANSAIAAIAGQTNLLSMNAAIEAAHAGAAGRGFAVVAAEIRKLSETSSMQSKTIGRRLKEIQSSIADVVGASHESSAAFTAVSDEIVRTNQIVRQIKDSMEEQNRGSRQVVDALRGMQASSGEVADAARDMARGNRTILESVDGLKESSERMKAGMEEMAEEARRVGESGGELSEMSARMKDSIADIGGQMVQFKV